MNANIYSRAYVYGLKNIQIYIVHEYRPTTGLDSESANFVFKSARVVGQFEFRQLHVQVRRFFFSRLRQ